MGRIPFALFSLSLVLLWTGSSSAQVRAGLAHRQDAATSAAQDAAEPAAQDTAAASHDPDSDGALIGAGIGVIVGMIVASTAEAGEFGGWPVMVSGLGTGLVGLLVGAAVDAADPLTDPQAAAGPDSVAPPTVAAAPADTVAAGGGGPERSCSEGNDAIAALAGAGLVGILLAGAGPEPALIAALVGAVVVGGVVSVVEDAGQEGCPPSDPEGEGPSSERAESP